MNAERYGNQAAGSYGAQVEAAPVMVPRFDGPATHLEEMMKGLAEYHQRLTRVTDRLSGPTPEPVEKEGGRTGSTCVAARYEAIADTYATLLRRLYVTLERLEAL